MLYIRPTGNLVPNGTSLHKTDRYRYLLVYFTVLVPVDLLIWKEIAVRIRVNYDFNKFDDGLVSVLAVFIL